MLAGKPDFAFAAANGWMPLLLVGMIDNVGTALVWIVGPRFCDHGLQMLADPRMNFIHVGDDLLGSFRLVELIEPVSVILIAIRLQQAALAWLAVSRVPYLEILIGGAEAVQPFVFPVTSAHLKCCANHGAVYEAVNYFALLR